MRPIVTEERIDISISVSKTIGRPISRVGRGLGLLRGGVVAAVGLLLAACSIGSGAGQLSSGQLSSGLSAPANGAAGKPRALKAKVALLLPLSGTAQAAAIAKGMKQAAEMALFELNNPGFQMVVKDTAGTPEGAAAAAKSAVADGAELILGPLYARSVTAAGNVARPAGLPVIAFSNDRTVAGNGVYLLSFLADEEVDRIISYAAGRGKRAFAALVPDTPYGKIMTAAFRRSVGENRGSVVAIETYPVNTNGMLAPSQRLFKTVKTAADAGRPVDAIFLPGGPETLPSLAPLIKYANLEGTPVKFLGSGGWDYPNLGRNRHFIGSWYPAPDPRGWQAFSEKFARTFGAAPPRISTLSYDAVTIAIRLATANPPGQRFLPEKLTRPTGFTGVDGAFRLTPNGTAEHNLAVLEVRNVGPAMVDPPAASFDAARGRHVTGSGRPKVRSGLSRDLSGGQRRGQIGPPPTARRQARGNTGNRLVSTGSLRDLERLRP